MKRKGRGGFFIIIGSVDFIAAGQSSIFGHFSAALAVFKNKEVQCNYLSVNQDRENFLCTKKRREWNIKKYQKWTLFTTVNRKKPWAGLAQNSCKRFAVFGTLFRAWLLRQNCVLLHWYFPPGAFSTWPPSASFVDEVLFSWYCQATQMDVQSPSKAMLSLRSEHKNKYIYALWIKAVKPCFDFHMQMWRVERQKFACTTLKCAERVDF